MTRTRDITIPDALFARADLSWPAKMFLAYVIARVRAPMTLEDLGEAMLGAKPRTVQAWIAELHGVGLLDYVRTGRGLLLTPADTQESAGQTRRNLRTSHAGNGGSGTQESAGHGRVAEIRVSDSQISAHRAARAPVSSEKKIYPDQHVAADLDAPARETESSSTIESSTDHPERAAWLWEAWSERFERVRGALPVRHAGGDDIELAKVERSIAANAAKDDVPFEVLAARTLDLYWGSTWPQNLTNAPTLTNLVAFLTTYVARARKALKPAPVKARAAPPEMETAPAPTRAELERMIAESAAAARAGSG